MTLEEYLSTAYFMNEHINILLEEKAELDRLSTAINCDMSKERVQTSMSGDKLPNVIAKIVDLDRLIDREIDAYVDRKEDIRKLLSSVANEIQWNILYNRYVKGMNWEEIAKHIGYCEKQTKRIHNMAIILIKQKHQKKIARILKMSRNVLVCPR